MTASFHFDDPEHFTAGTVGPKGQRVFYLQAVGGADVVSLRIEKQQVAALAEYLDQLLDDVPALDDNPPFEPGELREPLAPAWIVGALGVAYDESADRVVIVAEELVDDDHEGDTATARFAITRAQARGFIDRSRTVVAAGREPCPYCGRPLDPGADWCPCHN